MCPYRSNENILDALSVESEQSLHDAHKPLSPRLPNSPREHITEDTHDIEEEENHAVGNVFDTEEELETRQVSFTVFRGLHPIR